MIFGRKQMGITANDLADLTLPIVELGAELAAVRAELKAVKEERDRLFTALIHERSARLQHSEASTPE